MNKEREETVVVEKEVEIIDENGEAKTEKQEEIVVEIKEDSVPNVTSDETMESGSSNNDIKKREEEELLRQSEIKDTLGRKIKEEEDRVKSKNLHLEGIRDTSEVFGAFMAIFQDASNVFQKEFLKIASSISEEKLKLYAEIKEGFEKNGKLSLDLLNKTGLLNKEKELLVSVAQDLVKADSLDATKDNIEKTNIFKNLVGDSKKIIESARSVNIASILSGASDMLESGVSKDLNEEVEKDTLRDKDKDVDRQRNQQRVRAR